MDCRPALPFYCANIHIGCAGRSKLATEPFSLSFNVYAALHREGHAPVPLSVTHSDGVSVFRAFAGPDWVRVVRREGYDVFDFSQRIYRAGSALMTRGTCRHSPGPIARPSRSSP
ncbi:MAG: hypothetical protein AAF409_15550 [Pseudomonadota bacterium]